MINILVVEDDEKLNMLTCNYLTNQGYHSVGALSANAAYDEIYHGSFDLIISDIMMPQIDGFEFAKTIRGLNENIPILFMSARDDISSKQRGFRIGVDDYMVKPIDMDELLLRVGALLRRSHIMQNRKMNVGNLLLDADALSAAIDNEEIAITVREFNILYKLLSYPNKAFSRASLMNEFWDAESETSLRSVDVYITKLREKFSTCNGFKIVTIHGLGYKAVLL
ncbi:response regulator transcription factor [Anaerorhabdus sp.]|uniref:response regulator transcription factor n=1 Tax=Anaerorhabdus sp. TaxID=1872524 RepID=UPI002B1F8EE3|nr:response regulator transcription factor [Anaerorhabdus sp.]MEA4873887.1 response regulator transcription factor [Anaerorhabdus sp.]